MTPLELFEYKRSWMSSGTGYTVAVPEDLDASGKSWCRANLKPHQWHFSRYTDVWEHTFYFENEEIGKLFAHEFLGR